MRQFSEDYLSWTREGMWEDSRAALADLSLGDRAHVVDVGCGTGELTRVLAAESPGCVLGIDRDGRLLAVAMDHAPVVRGDAATLPLADDGADLVVCQALLINLVDPGAAVAEFARVSRDLVGAIEPDNSAVRVESTVDAEAPLARRARQRYLDGVGTDVTLGADVREIFEAVGLELVSTTRYNHERTVSPPYSQSAIDAARRMATGRGIASDRETMLAGGSTPEEIDRLTQKWRAMGRTVVDQMQAEAYERREVVPFYVTVGRVADA